MQSARLDHGTLRHVLGAFGISLFMLALAALDSLTRGAVHLPSLVPPFGASAVIVFLTPDSPYGRAWNVVIGHSVCALAACSVLFLMPTAAVGVQAALAISSAGLLMLATRSFHPPGGATALLAIVASPKLGFAMALCPMLAGSLTLVGVRALLTSLVERVRGMSDVRAIARTQHSAMSTPGEASAKARTLA